MKVLLYANKFEYMRISRNNALELSVAIWSFLLYERACLEAGRSCSPYQFSGSRKHRERRGAARNLAKVYSLAAIGSRRFYPSLAASGAIGARARRPCRSPLDRLAAGGFRG